MNSQSHNNQNKIAVINDFSGFGRCSIAVSLPIISQMKIQCCPVPTSIFSNHTGFPHFFFDDYTDKMLKYIDNWKKLDLQFQGILSGFLGSKKQIEIVKDFINNFKTEDTVIIIDPVMGDNGKPYPTYTHDMCQAMKELAKQADILTPNLTEACILTDTTYEPDRFTVKDYYKMIEKIADFGPSKIVITGIAHGSYIYNIIYEKGSKPRIFKTQRIYQERSGTGDVFASIIAADAVHKVNFYDSVKKASAFVKKCLNATEKFDIPRTDGVCFEEVLHTLK